MDGQAARGGRVERCVGGVIGMGVRQAVVDFAATKLSEQVSSHCAEHGLLVEFLRRQFNGSARTSQELLRVLQASLRLNAQLLKVQHRTASSNSGTRCLSLSEQPKANTARDYKPGGPSDRVFVTSLCSRPFHPRRRMSLCWPHSMNLLGSD